MKLFISSLCLLMVTSVYGTTLLPVKGRVLRIEKGNAIILGAKGETHIKMKSLSKSVAQLIRNAGSKKTIQFKVTPHALVGIGEVY